MFLLSFNVTVTCVCAAESLLNLAVRQQTLVLFEQSLLQSKLAHTNMTPREESQDLRKCSWDLKWDVRWPQCCVQQGGPAAWLAADRGVTGNEKFVMLPFVILVAFPKHLKQLLDPASPTETVI